MERLKNHREFVAVLKRRRRVTDADIVLHYIVHAPSDSQHDGRGPTRRLGLAVSKSVGNAVVRNTVKRRFRVLAHRYEDELPADCDIVLRAKPGAAHASFQSLEAQMQTLFRAVTRKSEQS